jgi:membrane-associated protease RseP (regulator of RpoE activity)
MGSLAVVLALGVIVALVQPTFSNSFATTPVVTPAPVRARDVATLTAMYTAFMRAGHGFSAHDGVTVFEARSMLAAQGPKNRNLAAVLSLTYEHQLYAYVQFYLLKGASYRAEVVSQDGGSNALYVKHNGYWRALEQPFGGFPPCGVALLHRFEPLPVARVMTARYCTGTQPIA